MPPPPATRDDSRLLFPVIAALALLVVLLPLMSAFAAALSREGFDALVTWWSRPHGWRLLLATLAFAAVGATVALLAGWAVALLLPARGAARTVVLALCCLPLLVPSSLMGVGWIMAMGRDAVVTNALRPIVGDAVPTIYAWPLAAAATGLRYFGVAALVLAAARAIPVTSRAAERVFGLSCWTRARLRIGATGSAALVAWLLLLLLVQGDHILPGMFLVHTFGTEVLIQFTALLDPAGAAALALVPAAIALGVLVACAAILRRKRTTWTDRDDASHAGSGVAVGASLASSRRILAIAMILLIAVGLPLMGLVVRAQSVSNLRDAWAQSRAEVVHSVRLALLGAIATVLLSIPLAHAWVAAERRRGTSASPLALLNLAVPGSLLALGILFLPAPRVLTDTNAGVVYGYAARFAAVAAVVLLVGWMRLSPTADLAARVHGVPAIQRLVRLTLPARTPALVAALGLVALLAAAELEMSLILVRPGLTTLGVRLYTMIHTAPDHVVAAMAVDVLILVTLTALFFAAAAHLLRRRIA